jgi:hypothetical protein
MRFSANAAEARSTKTNDMRVIAKGAFSAIQEPTSLVVTNETQWEELWRKHSRQTPAPPAPKIDFSKETILFVCLGRKNSGGYHISVKGINHKDRVTVVEVETASPPKGSMSIQALTAPFEIVAAPKLEGKIEFQTTERHSVKHHDRAPSTEPSRSASH